MMITHHRAPLLRGMNRELPLSDPRRHQCPSFAEKLVASCVALLTILGFAGVLAVMLEIFK